MRTINRLINALPQGRTPTKQRSDLWRKVIGDLPTQHTGAGLRWAARELQFCKRWAGYGLRDCLAEGHDHNALDLITLLQLTMQIVMSETAGLCRRTRAGWN